MICLDDSGAARWDGPVKKSAPLCGVVSLIDRLERRGLLCALVHSVGESRSVADGLAGFEPLRWEGKQSIATERIAPAAVRSSLTVPALSSRPGAQASLYIDFDGDFSSVPWAGSVPGATPAFDQDGNPASFSTDEIAAMTEIWERVAEKYSPFNLNVTTVSPAVLSDRRACRVVVGGNGAWFGNAGGVAYVGAFYNGASNTAWTFSALRAQDRVWVADVISHEAGHMFGLEHQSRYDANGVKLQEYFSGDAFRAPIMGNSSSSQRGQWWQGPSSTGVNAIQNDLQILSSASNAFGYSSDAAGEAPNTIAPTAGSVGDVRASSVIERTGESDWWMFESTGGSVTARSSVVKTASGATINTLDTTLEIRRPDGTLVQRAATSSFDEQIVMSLPAGLYVASVVGGPNYGDVGQYDLRISGASRPVTQTDYTGPAGNFAALANDYDLSLTVAFDDSIRGTIDLGDLQLINQTNGLSYAATQLILDPDDAASALFVLPLTLPDGNYIARVPAGAVADSLGNLSPANYDYAFTLLRGDTDFDRDVDFADLLTVAQNFGQVGRMFMQGNFNYDPEGRVDFSDLLILAQRFGTSLLQTPAASTPAASTPSASTPSASTLAKNTPAKSTLVSFTSASSLSAVSRSRIATAQLFVSADRVLKAGAGRVLD